jgi:hypothetical protein
MCTSTCIFIVSYFLCVIVVRFSVIWSLPLCDVVFDFQMLESSLPHIVFADGASRSTQNLASVAWAIYTPTNELVTLRGVCLGRVTNNIAEYSTIIELLIDAILLDIRHLVVRLNSQLIVL